MRLSLWDRGGCHPLGGVCMAYRRAITCLVLTNDFPYVCCGICGNNWSNIHIKLRPTCKVQDWNPAKLYTALIWANLGGPCCKRQTGKDTNATFQPSCRRPTVGARRLARAYQPTVLSSCWNRSFSRSDKMSSNTWYHQNSDTGAANPEPDTCPVIHSIWDTHTLRSVKISPFATNLLR